MPRLRQKLITLHRWTGLALGLLWIFQALTGSMLVFVPELQRSEFSDLKQGPMTSLTRVAEDVGQSTGDRVQRIRVLDRQHDLLGVDCVDHLGIWHLALVEAATGRVLETIQRDPAVPTTSNFWRWVYTAHTTLLGGKSGEVLIGASGLVLAVSLVLGFGIGWPRRGAWKPVVQAHRWKTTSQKLYGWHRAIGIGSAAVLLPVVLSGAYIVFQQPVNSALARVMSFDRPFSGTPSDGHPVIRVTPELAYLLAKRAFPAASFESIVLPTPKLPVYSVRLRQPGESRVWIGTTTVVIDPTKGGVLYKYDALRSPIANRMSDAAYPLHIGELLGLSGRILVMFSGLALGALGSLGLAAWWRKPSHAAKKVRAGVARKLSEGQR